MAGGPTFEEVFQDLFIAAFHVSLRILGNPTEAEDVAAETAARALDRWARVGSMPSPSPWVVRVATNLAIDIVRRRRFVADGRVVADGRAPEPQARPEETDASMAVREMLRHLPRRQRDVLALRYLVDLSETEIAHVLRISPGSVKRHASRALDRLRRNHPEGMIRYA